MTQSVIWLFVASLALLIIGSLALIRCAFREALLWGLFALLLPPVLLWYAMTRWRQTQYSVYTIAASLLLMTASLYGGAAAPVADYLQQSSLAPVLTAYGWNGRITLPFTTDRDIPVPNAAEVEALRAAEASARRRAPAASTVTEKSVSTPAPAPVLRYQAAAFDVLAHYTGRQIRVHVMGGGVIEGVLVAVGGDGITVDAAQSTGTVGYALTWSRLARVEVYAPAGSVRAPTRSVTTVDLPATTTGAASQ